MNSTQPVNLQLIRIKLQVMETNKALREHEKKIDNMMAKMMVLTEQILSITVLLKKLVNFHVH